MVLLIACVSVGLFTGWPAYASQADDDFIVHNGDRTRKRVAITMDDCYRLGNVTRTLDICEQYQVPVTFFVVGSAIKPEHQSIWHRALSLGCEIGNHTYSHVSVAKASPTQVRAQIRETQDRLDSVLGFSYPMRYFRPPYGKIKRANGDPIRPILEEEGFEKVILWDVSNIHFKDAYPRVRNGSILLFHANIMDVKCIEQLVPKLLEDGYEMVTVSELFDRPPLFDPSMLPATTTNLPAWVPVKDTQTPSDLADKPTMQTIPAAEPIPTPKK